MYKTIEVDVDLEDFDDEDILDEVDRRELNAFDRVTENLIYKIYEKKRTNQNYDSELDELIDKTIGRI